MLDFLPGWAIVAIAVGAVLLVAGLVIADSRRDKSGD